MPHKNFRSAFFRIGHHTVEFRPANKGSKYPYDIAVNYNNCQFSWNGNHAPSITQALNYISFAKAEFDQQTEAAKYE